MPAVYRAAAGPAGKDRLAAGSLDDHATDRADAVFARTVLLAERRWNPSGDLDELTAIHKGLFEGVFEDAGKLRTSNTTREVTNDRARAANPEAFFPEKGGSTREAKGVCASCEVRAECLEYALMNDERFGIWGGLSERERRRLRRAAS